MVNTQTKIKNCNILSKGQSRLLKESLKMLLGPGLGQTPEQKSQREEKATFLKDALNSKFLNNEWLV